MPRVSKMDKYREQRIEFASAMAGHIISVLNVKEKNKEILSYAENAAFDVWIDRGKKLIGKIDASIFKE